MKCGGGGGGGGAVRFRSDTKSRKQGGGGGAVHLSPIQKAGGGCCPFKARYEKRGCPFKARYEKRGGGSASGPIQKAGKGEGLFSRRGGITIYERGGCNPQNPPPGSASRWGCCPLQARYEKQGVCSGVCACVCVLYASGPIRKAGGGGGRVVAVRFRSDTKSGKGGGGGAVRFRLDSIISTRPRQTKNYTTFEIGYNQPAYTTV